MVYNILKTQFVFNVSELEFNYNAMEFNTKDFLHYKRYKNILLCYKCQEKTFSITPIRLIYFVIKNWSNTILFFSFCNMS